jgi:hypothetical protein
MQRRTFGWTGVQVPVIGQGTWKMEGDSPAEAWPRSRRARRRHDPRRHRRAVRRWAGRVAGRARDRRAARRGVPRLQGDAQPREPQRHGAGVRGEPAPAGDGPPGLLPPALAGAAPAGGHHRGVRAAGAGREDPQLGPEQLRRGRLEEALAIAGPRRIACNQVLYHLRARDIEGASFRGASEHEVAVVGYSPFGSGDFPQPQSRGRQGARESGPGARGDRAPGGAGFPRPGSATSLPFPSRRRSRG